MYLFHYTLFETLETILKTNKLMFKSINDTNDPYEAKIYNIYDIEYESDSKLDEISELEKKIDKAKDEIESIQLEYKETKYYEGEKKAEAYKKHNLPSLVSNLSSYRRRLKIVSNEYNKIKNNNYDIYHMERMKRYRTVRNGLVKIACFCSGSFNVNKFNEKNTNDRRQGFFHPRMWVQYAKNSTGCCIVFLKDKLKETYNTFSSEYYLCDNQVEYDDLLHLGGKNKNINIDVYRDISKSGIIKHLKKYVMQLFFCKDKDWEDENEYRFLLINKEQNRKRSPCFMDIKNTIDSIILGENFTDSLDIISQKCKKENIKLYKLYNNLGVYNLISIEK